MDIEELADTFELLGDWEERYRYLIELGRKLPPLPEAEHSEANKVRGCMSQVWLNADVANGVMNLRGDSDSHLVKGLIALLFKLTDGRPPKEVLDADIAAAFTRLGLENHITMNRRNGFYSMVESIKGMAAQAAAQSP